MRSDPGDFTSWKSLQTWLTLFIGQFEYVKVGSYDPIFESNYSLAHSLDSNWTCERHFLTSFQHVLFHPIISKEPPVLYFPTLDLAKYFYKMAATAGSSCGEVGMKFSKQELLKFSSSSRNNWIQKLDRGNTNKFHHAHKKFQC